MLCDGRTHGCPSCPLGLGSSSWGSLRGPLRLKGPIGSHGIPLASVIAYRDGFVPRGAPSGTPLGLRGLSNLVNAISNTRELSCTLGEVWGCLKSVGQPQKNAWEHRGATGCAGNGIPRRSSNALEGAWKQASGSWGDIGKGLRARRSASACRGAPGGLRGASPGSVRAFSVGNIKGPGAPGNLLGAARSTLGPIGVRAQERSRTPRGAVRNARDRQGAGRLRGAT